MTQSPDPALRTVYLYGHLARGIGRKIELAFDAPAGALRLLELNFPGFLQRFKEGKYHVSVRNGGRERDLSVDQLSFGFTGDELHVMPRATGRGKGKSLLTALVGGLIIGAAFLFSGGALATTALPGIFGATGATFGTLATLGAGLVLQGIGSLLVKTPKTDYNEEGNKSYIFNGPVNVNEQGGVMPLIFGKHMAGSVVISAALDVENSNPDVSDTDQEVLQPHVHLRNTQQSDSNSVSLADMIKNPNGATLTHINGQAIAGTGTLAMGTLSIRYNTAGELIQRADERSGPFARNRIRHVFFTWTASGSRPPGEEREVPFRIRYNGVDYNGVIRVTMGSQTTGPGRTTRGGNNED